MESTVTAIAIVVGLSLWHVRNRRRPGWLASDDGRFFIYLGYPLVAIAAYWLMSASGATSWQWAVGNLWALAAMACFVKGFDALHQATARHADIAQELETVDVPASALTTSN